MSRLSVKVKMENWKTERSKCRENRWECKEWHWNAEAENQMGIQGIWVEMQQMREIRVAIQGGNGSIAVE